MAYPRNIVSKEQRIFSLPLVPDLCSIKRARVEVKNSLTFLDERRTYPPSKEVTKTDSTGTTEKGCRQCWLKLQFALGDKISRKHQKGFIRNGKSENPQHEQGEQCPVAIVADPREDRFHKLFFSFAIKSQPTFPKKKCGGLIV